MTEHRRRITVVNSITEATEPGLAMVVSGSHGGINAVRYALRIGVKAAVFNDAGVGKEGAGIAGLEDAQRFGLLALAVDYRTARIGDGADTLHCGIVSACNGLAVAAGVSVGDPLRDAVIRVVKSRLFACSYREASAEPHAKASVVDAKRQILILDSASEIAAGLEDWVVVTGSHGGRVSGRGIKHRVRGAVFNDAGVGKDSAGISRLPLLAAQGIPAATVSHTTARIGDGMDTYVSGVISHANAAAARIGIQVGQRATEATIRMACT